ncbi:hypothetical protein [Streptomyces sclerotialus]
MDPSNQGVRAEVAQRAAEIVRCLVVGSSNILSWRGMARRSRAMMLYA